MLGGSSHDLYRNRNDLIALKVPEDPDRLTSLVQDNLGCLFEVSSEKLDMRIRTHIHLDRNTRWPDSLCF
jgi:hypothetical protein